ncbi:MAG: hypothetical protein ACKO0X_04045 [Bacteroidota bacterium]
MDTNEMMEKILFEARVERERVFLDDARLFLINAIIQCESEKGLFGLDIDSTKMIGLVERMISAELDCLDQEPETYLELYGD